MAIEDKKNLGWVIIIIMMFSILKNLFVVLYFGFLNMRKKMREMFSAEDDQIDTPHTSDDASDTIDSVDTSDIEEEIRREEYERHEYNERIKKRQEERKDEKHSGQVEKKTKNAKTKHKVNADGPGHGHFDDIDMYGNSGYGNNYNQMNMS